MNRTHWGQHGDDCFPCKIQGISFAASCTPGRRTNALYGAHADTQLDRDRDAYQRLRADGLQPPRMAGSAALERSAEHRLQVEMGYLGDAKKFEEGERISRDLGVKA